MSAPFAAIGTAGSALRVYRTWLDTVSHNIANTNAPRAAGAPPFRPQAVVARTVDTDPRSGQAGGIEVAAIVETDDEANLADQMVQMMVAQRAYQSNLAVVDRARDSYLAALQIGR